MSGCHTRTFPIAIRYSYLVPYQAPSTSNDGPYCRVLVPANDITQRCIGRCRCASVSAAVTQSDAVSLRRP